jgi:branched-subunit amino acid ABC-type transport system permease component
VIVFWVGFETGIALACLYLLIAVSFTLIVAVSGVFSFLQATLIMLATVFAYVLSVEWGWSNFAIIPLLIVFGLVAGLLTHLMFVRPLMGRTRDMLESSMLTTLGASTAINAIAGLLFGSNTRPMPSYAPLTPFKIGSVPIDKTNVVIVAVCAVLMICFQVVLRRTSIGRVTRITLEDTDGAQLMGVNTVRVIMISFCVAGAMAMIAGWLVAPVLSASAYSAQNQAFFAFAAMAIGGFGSFNGAMIGAVVVGMGQGLIPAYLSPSWTIPLLLVFALVLLIIKPTGLLGRAGLFGAAAQRQV